MPKTILAPYALKGSCTAALMARGVARALPNAGCVQVPVAEGGDGLAEVLTAALDAGLAHVADLIAHDLGLTLGDLPGAGAAGGLGVVAFGDATLGPGAELVPELLCAGTPSRGRRPVAHGGRPHRRPNRLRQGSRRRRRAPSTEPFPCLAIAGGIGEDIGLCRAPIALDEAQRNAEALLANAAE
ncbi:hypothetical protein CKO31_23610 [Thiohalocapsa halophila]|uniref:Glycerate kinase n=1 Tax=Thiohalocapsa halophila TaxID=69359 RepID=A0ABS1CP11_9GAMM|nr:glycerate kinase [Thiohalocapsa halophila]MBK1633675.1 hypothetical protein [Thiohalocapsa halophila]